MEMIDDDCRLPVTVIWMDSERWIRSYESVDLKQSNHRDL